MNIVRIPRLLKHSTLLLTILGASFLLSACGGGGKSNSSSSAASSSTSSHTFSSSSVTPPGSGTWPNVKVSASGTKSLKFDWSVPTGATYYKLLKKADSNSTYVQVGADFTANTISDPVSVHLTDWVNSRYKIQACVNSASCSDSSEIVADSAMLSAITYLKSSNAEANDWFGWSVTISGDGKTMAVGAPAESSKATGIDGDKSSNDSPTSGAVYVFAKVNGNWQEEAYLKASNTEQPGDGVVLPIPNPNSRFGYQVALSSDGNTLAVSAINEDSISISVNCDPHNIHYASSAANSIGYALRTSNTDIGSVYVFKRTNTQWNQQAYIKPFVGYYFGNTNISFGYSLALSGDGKTLAVGTAVEGTQGAGIGTITANSSSVAFACLNFSSESSVSSGISSSSSSRSSSSRSSSSVSSGSSTSSVVPGGNNSGAVYIYKLKEKGWIEDAYVKADNAGVDDYFGASITLSNDGNLMAVGAIGEDSKDANDTNDTIVIGGGSYVLDNGAVYIFTRGANEWTQDAKLKPSYAQVNQQFGASIAFSADASTLAIGAPGDWTKTGGINQDASLYDPLVDDTSASGAAFIFVRTGSAWTQQSYIKPATVIGGHRFGDAVSLSGDGNILAVGAWVESSLAKGINGDALDTSSADSGAAYIFTRAGTTWSQMSYIKAPNSNPHDRFGRALKLDDTGKELLIGAYRESSKAVGINGDKADNSATAAGAAYIY